MMVERINLSNLVITCVVLQLLLSINGANGIRLNPRRWRWAAPKTAGFSEVIHTAAQVQQQDAGGAAGAAGSYCVARTDADATQLQTALDWACSQISCAAIQSGGACYSGGLVAHASYAFDVYYASHVGAGSTCNFSGLATLTSSNPSTGSCIYPAAGQSSGSANSSLAPPAPPASGYGSTVTPPGPPSSVASPPSSPSTIFSPTSNTTLSPPMTGTSPSESILPNLAAPTSSLGRPASFVCLAVVAAALYL